MLKCKCRKIDLNSKKLDNLFMPDQYIFIFLGFSICAVCAFIISNKVLSSSRVKELYIIAKNLDDSKVAELKKYMHMNTMSGESVLSYCIYKNDIETTKTLLQLGVNPSQYLDEIRVYEKNGLVKENAAYLYLQSVMKITKEREKLEHISQPQQLNFKKTKNKI